MGRGLSPPSYRPCSAHNKKRPGEEVHRDAFTLGAGAKGREASRVEYFVALSEATAGESLATFAASSICGTEQIKSSAAMTICHLSIASGFCKSVTTCNEVNILYNRPGGTGPLVTFCVVRLSSLSVCLFSNGGTRPKCENVSTFLAWPCRSPSAAAP